MKKIEKSLNHAVIVSWAISKEKIDGVEGVGFRVFAAAAPSNLTAPERLRWAAATRTLGELAGEMSKRVVVQGGGQASEVTDE